MKNRALSDKFSGGVFDFGLFVLQTLQQYFIALKNSFSKMWHWFLAFFILLKLAPRFENVISEHIAPNTVLALWVCLVYFSLYALFSAYLPINPFSYKRVRNGFLKTRNYIFPASVILCYWLILQAVYSLFSGEFLYEKIYAALLMQAVFIPFFIELPQFEDAEEFRNLRKYFMPEWKKTVYKFWIILVFLLFAILPLFMIHDIFSMPNFKISN